MSYSIYPPIPWSPEVWSSLQAETPGPEGPSAPSILAQGPPPDVPPQVGSMEWGPRGTYHLNVVQPNRGGFKAKEQTFKKKLRSTIEY